VKCEHPELPEDACAELKALWATLKKCWSRDPGQRPDIRQLILGRSFERASVSVEPVIGQRWKASAPVASILKGDQRSPEPVHHYRYEKEHRYQDEPKGPKSANATTRLAPPLAHQPNKERQYQPNNRFKSAATERAEPSDTAPSSISRGSRREAVIACRQWYVSPSVMSLFVDPFCDVINVLVLQPRTENTM
jgi:hypothetical protein